MSRFLLGVLTGVVLMYAGYFAGYVFGRPAEAEKPEKAYEVWACDDQLCTRVKDAAQ